MNNDQMSLLAAALQRAAATMGQSGMQPTPNAQVDARFGGMQPPAPMPPPNDQVAARFGGMQPPSPMGGGSPMPPSVPMPQPRPGGAIAQSQMGLAPYDPNGSLSNKDANSIYDSFAASKAGQQMGMGNGGGMGFFARNAAMMHDPVTGMFIDPSAATQAQGNSGNIIQKMMGLLNNKANNA